MFEESIREGLRESVIEVLERMFFLEAGGECAAPRDPAEYMVASLAFEGEPSGVLTLWLTASAAKSLAADFLGTDPEEISQGRCEEVICELANMICGSVLSRSEGATTFHLSAPGIVTTPGQADTAGAFSFAAELENGILAVSVTTGIPTCLESAPSVS